MVQRVVFINLHSCWMFLKNAEVLYFKTSAALKHKYLLDFLLNNPNYEVCSYVTPNGFSLTPKGYPLLAKFLSHFRFAESKHILRKNGINPESITIIKCAEEIHPDDIVVLYNILGHCAVAKDIHAFKALSMLHFHGRKEENELIENAGISCYFNDL